MPRKNPPKKGTILNKSQRYQEILKCGEDPKYFIKKYIKISHPTKGLVKFDLFPFQEECLDAFIDHNKIIINKSRQLGLSTVSAAYSLWMALFHRERNVLVIATKLDIAKNFIKKVRANLEGLPDWLVLPQITGESVKYLQFSNGSQIKAIPTAADAGRSESLSLLVVDECAHVEGIDELWLGLAPTLSTGGSAILISSPSGVGTLFHKIWVGANNNKNTKQEGENGFHPIELPWTVHPERDQKWFEEQKASIIAAKGERGVSQELLCGFQSSGDTFLKGDSMDWIATNIKNPIAINTFDRDEIWIWEYPQPHKKYIISADIARGDGDDFSSFHVIDIIDSKVVVDYKGKMPPDRVAELLIQHGYMFNTALICQELNNVGVAAAIKLKDMKYPNLYYEKFMKNIYMSYITQDVGDEMPGFTTDVNTRVEMLAKLENSIRNKKIQLPSKRLYEELQTFIWKGNKPQAQKGYNDDMVMSLAIGCNLYEASDPVLGNTADNAMAMLKGMSRDSKVLDTYTGKQQSLVDNPNNNEEKNITDDGMWRKRPELQTLQGQLQYQKQLLVNQKNVDKAVFQNNRWKYFKWVIDD